jgi:hypothetical protein
MWIFRSFPQENEKNNRATLMRQLRWRSHTLISVALKIEVWGKPQLTISDRMNKL